jgi:hypothetical protein
MSRTIGQRERGREKTRRWRAALSEEQRAAIRTQDRITAQARYHSLTVDEKAERLRKRAERRLAQRRAGVSEETIALWAENAAKRGVTKDARPTGTVGAAKGAAARGDGTGNSRLVSAKPLRGLAGGARTEPPSIVFAAEGFLPSD